MTSTTEAGGVSSKLYRDSDHPCVKSFSELLSPRVDKAEGKRIRSYMIIHELSPVLAQHEASNLEANLEQMWLFLHGSDKLRACREAKTCSGGGVFGMQPQNHQFGNRCKAFGLTASQLDL